MDGTHDLGGMQGFGPVRSEGRSEPPFHEPWEGRVHGTMIALAAGRNLPGGFRYAIERMGAVEYLTTTYYEHWLAAIETLLDESGLLPRSELAARVAAGPARPGTRLDPELAVRVRAVLVEPRSRQWPGAAHRFPLGARVRARRDVTTHPGHTRCPRYVRGMVGVVDRLCPLEPLPEGLPERRLEPVPCYTVRFASIDLWGPGAEPFTVSVDLVEPYLEEVDDDER
jgi:nitrile hydratase